MMELNPHLYICKKVAEENTLNEKIKKREKAAVRLLLLKKACGLCGVRNRTRRTKCEAARQKNATGSQSRQVYA